jgi:response regulator RpfG family c-di-GMP phosphodiesterase
MAQQEPIQAQKEPQQIISFLLVDDEEASLATLRTIVQRMFPNSRVFTSSNGNDAWMVLQQNLPHFIISDIQMPGMSGLDLCRRIKSSDKLKDTYCMLITAMQSREQRLEALEAGADDFLNKPFLNEELIARLRSAYRLVDLQLRLRDEGRKSYQLSEQLEKDFDEMTHLAVGLLQSRFPQAIQMLSRVVKITSWICKELGGLTPEEIRHAEIASRLCYAGKLFLPDTMAGLPICIDGKPTHELMGQVPQSARTILSTVKRFQPVGDVLYSLYENLDGSGFPDRLQSWQIPILSRIVRVALDFEETRERTRRSPSDALLMLQREAKRLYDPKILILLEEYIARHGGSLSAVTSKPVQLHELKEGMQLARDVFSSSGLKLLSKDAIITSKMVQQVLSHAMKDPIIGNIYVRISPLAP